MSRFRISLSIGVAALGLFLAAAPARAQGANLVSYVSSTTGSNSNACDTPTAPCASFFGALSKTVYGGEIRCLENHKQSYFDLTQPATIDCGAPGTLIMVDLGSPGVTVNLDEVTFPNGVVTLRNLNFSSAPGVVTHGIQIAGGGAAVHIENVTINGFAQQGIDFEPSSIVDLFVRDTVIRNNSGGILVAPAAGGRVSLSNVRLDQNAVYGLTVSKASGTFAAVTIEDSNIEKSVFGLRATGASAFIALSDSVVTNNSTGLQVQSGGKINSAGNNMITLNNVNGVPTAKFALQ